VQETKQENHPSDNEGYTLENTKRAGFKLGNMLEIEGNPN
jgi:hypothetical protein